MPFVIVLDDLHYADKDSVSLIKTIVDDTVRSRELKLLFVGASRPLENVEGGSVIDSNMHFVDGTNLYKNNTELRSDEESSSLAKIWGGRLPPMKSLPSLGGGRGGGGAAAAAGAAGDKTSRTSDDDVVKRFVRSIPTTGLRKIILPGLNSRSIESMLLKLFAIDCLGEEEKEEIYQQEDEEVCHYDNNNSNNNKNQDLADLASLVHKKTDGNAFVVVYVLRQLEKRGLLYYDDTDERWRWELDQIVEEIDSTELCVRDMIVDDLRKLDQRQRDVLITAACFGLSHFELSTIVHAMDVVNDQMELQDSINDGDFSSSFINRDVEEGDYTDHVTIRDNIQKTRTILDTSITNGFVQELSSGRFKFSHDRIREAAYSLLPSGTEREKVHLQIARQLRRWMDTEEETGVCLSSDMVILHAAKQYNFGQALITDSWERRDVAELNFYAAEVAAKKASFATSAYYLYNGLSVLGDNAWTDYYDLTLKMTTAYTMAQFACGEFNECISSADEVVAHGKEWSHKSEMYHIKLRCLLQLKRIEEGLELGRNIMALLGHPLPKRFLELHLIRDFLKVKSFFDGMTDDELRRIPEFEDDDYVEAMAVLARMMEFSFYGGPEIYFDVFAMRAFLAVKERGSHPFITPYGVGGWAWVLCVEGKFSEAVRFAKLGRELNDKLCVGKYRGIGARCKMIVCHYIYCWQEPLSSLLEPISNALTEMCVVGALDLYHQDVNTLLRHGFVSGMPLEELAKTCHKVLESLNDYGQPVFWNTSAPVAQAVSNFMGQSKNPTVLGGAYIDPEINVDDWEDSNKAVLNQYHLFSMIVKYHFGDYSGANTDMKKLNKSLWDDGPGKPLFSKLARSHILFAIFVFVFVFAFPVRI